MKVILAVTYSVEVEATDKRALRTAIENIRRQGESASNILGATLHGGYSTSSRTRPRRVEVLSRTDDAPHICSECGKKARGLRVITDAGGTKHFLHVKCLRTVNAWLAGKQ